MELYFGNGDKLEKEHNNKIYAFKIIVDEIFDKRHDLSVFNYSNSGGYITIVISTDKKQFRGDAKITTTIDDAIDLAINNLIKDLLMFIKNTK
jgi:hypothetical protein